VGTNIVTAVAVDAGGEEKLFLYDGINILQDLGAIKKLLGHFDIHGTMRYAHLVPTTSARRRTSFRSDLRSASLTTRQGDPD